MNRTTVDALMLVACGVCLAAIVGTLITKPDPKAKACAVYQTPDFQKICEE